MKTKELTNKQMNAVLEKEARNGLTKSPDVIKASERDFIASIAGYPAEVQDDVLWLWHFTRKRFNGAYQPLRTLAKELGMPSRSKGYWYAILTGKYFDLGTGEQAVRTLREFIASFRNYAKLDRDGGVPFIMTPTAKRVFDYIDEKRAPETICRFGAICGPTGAQKTAIQREYARRNNHGTVIHFECPARRTLSRFLTKIGATYNIGKSFTTVKREAEIFHHITAKRTLIIDNIQRAYDPRSGADQDIFNFLNELQDDTGCSVILSWTPSFDTVVRNGADQAFFEQMIGRLGGMDRILYLAPYAPMADIHAIAAAFKVRDTPGNMDLLKRLSREPGRIRVLFDHLQIARRAANTEGVEIVEARHFRDEGKPE